MTAILRWGTALLSLLLLTPISRADVWVTPVFKTPYRQAPGTYSGGYYSVDAYGQWSGPHYNLRPPYPPGGNILPGPIGQAIMAGNLPHELLMSKQPMSLGNVPLLETRKQQQQQQAQQSQGGPPPQQQAGMGQAPMLGSSAMQQFGMMQTPHAGMATGQYAMPMPYSGAMPYQQMQAPMGYAPKPMMWAPYPAPMPRPQPQPQAQPHAVYWKTPNGIWQVQNAPGLNPGPVPFTTIPGFQPGQPPLGVQPGQPMPMPMPAPGTGGGPGFNPMQQFNPAQQFDPLQRFTPFDPLSRMQPAQPNMQPLEMPRMDQMPPQMPKVGGTAYPVHPFTRSPRDFFMWGEVMEQERARANRPVPVP